MKKIKVSKNGDKKHWPNYFGGFKIVTKYFDDITNVVKRKMVLGQKTDEIVTVTK